jgi:hypothetical protein
VYIRATSAITLPQLQLVQSFGTGGSPSAQVYTTLLTSVSITTSWQRIQATVTVPSISGKALGSNGNSNLAFDIGLPINTTFSVDIAQVQIEPGPVATPFEQRPSGTELALCQRYYEQVNAFWIGNVTTGVTYGTMFTFAVQKRATPTMVSIVQAGAANGSMNTRIPNAFSGGKGGSTVATAATTIVAAGFIDVYSASAEL